MTSAREQLLIMLALLAPACHSLPRGFGDACIWNDDCPPTLHCSTYFGGYCTRSCTPYEGRNDCPGTPCGSDTGPACVYESKECPVSCIRELEQCGDGGECLDE